jgi:DNA polymerase I-like protein with 3'-5' exonuclease and polymerase domains
MRSKKKSIPTRSSRKSSSRSKLPVKEIKAKHKKERDVSKTAGLSILYGTGAAKLQEVLRKELGKAYSLAECKFFIEDYRNQFPGIKALRKELDRKLANQ